jgi:hypothetical protein
VRRVRTESCRGLVGRITFSRFTIMKRSVLECLRESRRRPAFGRKISDTLRSTAPNNRLDRSAHNELSSFLPGFACAPGQPWLSAASRYRKRIGRCWAEEVLCST